jgi:pyrroline-5-carboxylate reductase
MAMLAAKKVGFIGAGNMGEALTKGLLAAGRLKADQIMVSDIDPARLRFLESTYSVLAVTGNASLAQAAQVIVLAVKPNHVDGVLGEIRDSLGHLPLVISIAAGVPLARIQQGLGRPLPLIRVMPNTPALVLAGASAIAAGPNAGPDHVAVARLLFEAVGRVVEVPESAMDAVTALSGSGPAYLLLVMEALIDAGVLLGLPRPIARSLVVQTTLGSAKLFDEVAGHPGALKDQVTSPGGTTIHGLAVLERGAVRGLFMDAVAAAARRSEELGGK